MSNLGNVVNAEYDAKEKVLRLTKPLEGIPDHTNVQVQIFPEESTQSQAAWLELRGILSDEAGDELARLVNELFPPWKE